MRKQATKKPAAKKAVKKVHWADLGFSSAVVSSIKLWTAGAEVVVFGAGYPEPSKATLYLLLFGYDGTPEGLSKLLKVAWDSLLPGGIVFCEGVLNHVDVMEKEDIREAGFYPAAGDAIGQVIADGLFKELLRIPPTMIALKKIT